MKYFAKKLPLLELRGSPNEMGYKIGLQHKDLIQKEIRYLFETIGYLSPLSPSKEECLKLAAKYVPYARAYVPELIGEIEGIAEGVDLSFEEVFFLNCFSDITSDVSHPATAIKLFGCTSFGTSAGATTNGEVFVGQNFDLNIIFQDFPIVVKIKPESGPVSLIYTMAGVVGCIGQNSAGISVVNNKLFSSDSRPGVPFTFVVRKILEQETMGDAIEVILTAHRATGLNYLVGDSNGELFSLETTASDHEIIYSPRGYIGHTNHYFAQRLRPYQLIELGDSIVRWNRITKLLKAKCGGITCEYLKEALKDHVNYPKSICNHPDEKLPRYKHMKTISALIMQPAKRKMWVTEGNPCQNEFVEYAL